MDEFKLILLSEVDRTAIRKARHSGAFPLTQSRSPTGVGMAFILPPQSPAVNLDEAPWLPPGRALQRVEDAVGNRTVAIDTLLGRLAAGLLKATYEAVKCEGTTRMNPPAFGIVPANHWKDYKRNHESAHVWKTGDLRLYLGAISISEQAVWVTYFRVKIDRAGIDEIVANATPTVAETKRWGKNESEKDVAPANKGGAPPKEWWDDFWIEICRRIWIGDLNPKTQAELAEAMHEWVENHHGGDAGDTTIKAAARKLFKAWDLRSKT